MYAHLKHQLQLKYHFINLTIISVILQMESISIWLLPRPKRDGLKWLSIGIITPEFFNSLMLPLTAAISPDMWYIYIFFWFIILVERG